MEFQINYREIVSKKKKNGLRRIKIWRIYLLNKIIDSVVEKVGIQRKTKF